MTLVLSITNIETLDNGESTRLTLDRHGAIIGRSPHADWSLPDPRNYISSTHCEIEFRDSAYWVVDRSTNGLFLNGAKERLAAPHRIADGDELTIGQYRVAAKLADAPAQSAAPEPRSGWNGWDAPARDEPADRRGMGFDAPAPATAGRPSRPGPRAPALRRTTGRRRPRP
jgi:type VI secretion system FHA domain protein